MTVDIPNSFNCFKFTNDEPKFRIFNYQIHSAFYAAGNALVVNGKFCLSMYAKFIHYYFHTKSGFIR